MRSGLIAEFPDAARLIAAIQAVRGAGYVDIDAFTPRPMAGLDQLVSFTKTGKPGSSWPFRCHACTWWSQLVATMSSWPQNSPSDTPKRSASWPSPFITPVD